MTLDEYFDVLSNDYDGHDDQYKFLIDNLKNGTPFSYARFNDGEMMGIDRVGSVVARGDQVVDESLHKALTESIKHKQENYYVGIPCSKCFPRYNKLANELVGEYDFKVSAVALTNRNWAKVIGEMGEALQGKNIRYLSGDDQKLEFLQRKMNLNIVEHVKTSSRNSWKNYDNIKGYIDKVEDGDVVIISLGPTARILACEWFKEKPNTTFIDIGSILDPFTRGVFHNCHKGWENGFNITGKCQICN